MPKRLSKTQRKLILGLIDQYNHDDLSRKTEIIDTVPTWIFDWPL